MGECPNCEREITTLIKCFIEKIECEEKISIGRTGKITGREYLLSEDYEHVGNHSIDCIYYVCPECGMHVFGDKEESKIVEFLKINKDNSMW